MVSGPMRIKAPIDSVAEADPLLDAGADMFFCAVSLGRAATGSCPRRWQDGEQVSLSGLDELAALVERAHARGAVVHLALNDPQTTSRAARAIAERLSEIEATGVDAIIVSNLPVLRLVRERTRLPIVAGSYFSAINPAAVGFLAGLGVESVIFDRQVALSDLEAIAAAGSPVGLGAFVMAGACRSLALYCHMQLFPAEATREGVHLCRLPMAVEPTDGCEGAPDPEALGAVARRLRLPRSSCGLCAVGDFARHGVHVMKIVGRGHATHTKLAHVRAVRGALDALESGATGEDLYAAARAVHERIFGRPCSREDCYYPHFFED